MPITTVGLDLTNTILSDHLQVDLCYQMGLQIINNIIQTLIMTRNKKWKLFNNQLKLFTKQFQIIKGIVKRNDILKITFYDLRINQPNGNSFIKVFEVSNQVIYGCVPKNLLLKILKVLTENALKNCQHNITDLNVKNLFMDTTNQIIQNLQLQYDYIEPLLTNDVRTEGQKEFTTLIQVTTVPE